MNRWGWPQKEYEIAKQTLVFLRSWLADIFGHYDYTRHQCEGMKKSGKDSFTCCRRHRGHYGQHVSFHGEVFK